MVTVSSRDSGKMEGKEPGFWWTWLLDQCWAHLMYTLVLTRDNKFPESPLTDMFVAAALVSGQLHFFLFLIYRFYHYPFIYYLSIYLSIYPLRRKSLAIHQVTSDHVNCTSANSTGHLKYFHS